MFDICKLYDVNTCWIVGYDASQYTHKNHQIQHLLYVVCVVKTNLSLLFFLPGTTPLWSIHIGMEVPCRDGVTEAGMMAHSNHSGRVSSPDPYTSPFCFSYLLHKLCYTAKKDRGEVSKCTEELIEGGAVLYFNSFTSLIQALWTLVLIWKDLPEKTKLSVVWHWYNTGQH